MSENDIESGGGWKYDVVRNGDIREYFIEKDDPQTRIIVTENRKPEFQDGLFLESFENDEMDPETTNKTTRAPLSRSDFKRILQYLLKALNKSKKERLYAEAGAHSIKTFAAKYGTSFEDTDGDEYFFVTKEQISKLIETL